MVVWSESVEKPASSALCFRRLGGGGELEALEDELLLGLLTGLGLPESFLFIEGWENHGCCIGPDEIQVVVMILSYKVSQEFNFYQPCPSFARSTANFPDVCHVSLQLNELNEMSSNMYSMRIAIVINAVKDDKHGLIVSTQLSSCASSIHQRSFHGDLKISQY